MSSPERPPICRAIERAIRERRLSNADFARLLRRRDFNNVNECKWDPSTITRLIGGREPSLETIALIEDVLGMPRGQLFIDAGLVELPSSVEDAIRTDSALTPAWQRMALTQVQVWRDASAEERSMAARVAPDERIALLTAANS